MDTPGLQAFVTIVQAGGFRRAAERLGLSQTALSRRLQALEEALGTTLLERSTRSIALTRAGAMLLPEAERLLRELAAALDRVRPQRGARHDSVAVACLPTVATGLLPALLAEFCAGDGAPPAVRVVDASATEIEAVVREGTVDFGITLTRIEAWDLVAESLLTEPLLLVCPPGHRFAARESVTWQELEGETLIAIHRLSGNRALIDAATAGLSLPLDWRHEVQHMASAVGLVAAGVGLTVLPRLALHANPARVVAVRLEQPLVARSIGLLLRRGTVLPGAAARLARLVRVRLAEVGG